MFFNVCRCFSSTTRKAYLAHFHQNESRGSSSSASILSQSGIASNAVVDGNGYIVYLNQDDRTQYQQQPPIPYVPSEASLVNRGDPAVFLDRAPLRGNDVKTENDVRKTQEMTPSQPACVGVDTASIVPSKMVVEGIPSDSNLADMGATGETSAVAATPLEGSLTSSVTGDYPEKENGKRTMFRKRGTPKTAVLKTPVSPVKEHKAPKRHGHASGGRQKKKVRRSLTFSSPIKQEETLRATENIANALSSTSPEAEAGATCSASSATDSFGLPSCSTPLPSISNLLHSSTSAGISINIHVTNDANKERAAPHTKSEDVGAGSRVMAPATLEQTSKNTVRAEMVSRPEAPSLAHYPVPRYTVEWHGDYHHQDPGEVAGVERPRRYQDHHLLPTSVASNTTTSRFRYPYRDPNSSHSYYSQQRPFPAPATPLDRYYSSDYARDWTPGGTYARYPSHPPEHFMTGYEAQPHHHPAVSTSYPAVQWNASGWSRPPPEMFVESYQKRPPTSGRAGLDMDIREAPDLRDIPYTHFHRAAASYPRAQVEFPEEVYPHHRPAFSGYPGSVMVGPHAKERLVAAVPEEIQDARQPGEDFESQRLHRPWPMAANCSVGPQGVPEDSAGQLAAAIDSPQQLQPPVVPCAVLEQGHMEASDVPNQLSEEQASQM